jgi:hypothetical protein
MTLTERLPAVILGGDPFTMFRFLYRRDCLWKLFDEDYCLSVMRAAYEGGCRAFDLSFEVNARLFSRLLDETGDPLSGFGNPSWEQGVFFNGRYLQYSRDRIMKTLVERLFPRPIASLVKEKLSLDDVLVFGYDRGAASLSDEEIASIHLNKETYAKRLEVFEDCRYILVGGADADWLVSLGRTDIVLDMIAYVRSRGFTPLVLSQFPTLVLPALESAGCDAEGYAVPLNKNWSWFDRDECVEVIQSISKPIVAFMAFASDNLKKDITGAMEWLYGVAGVESILFGTAIPEHARQTSALALSARGEMDHFQTNIHERLHNHADH